MGRTRCCSHRPTKDVLGIAIVQQYTEGCNTIRRLDQGTIFRGDKIDRMRLPRIQIGLPPSIRPTAPFDDQRDTADRSHLTPICPGAHIRIQRLIPGRVHTCANYCPSDHCSDTPTRMARQPPLPPNRILCIRRYYNATEPGWHSLAYRSWDRCRNRG